MMMVMVVATAAVTPNPPVHPVPVLPAAAGCLNGGGRCGWSGSWSRLPPLLHPGPRPPRSTPADVARPGRRRGGHVSARRGGASCAPGKCRAPLPGRAGSAEPPVPRAFGQRSRRVGRPWALGPARRQRLDLGGPRGVAKCGVRRCNLRNSS